MIATRPVLAALASLATVVAPAIGVAAEQVKHAPPSPAVSLPIADGTAPTSITYQPTGLVTFQSKLGSGAEDKIEAYVWKPAGASATAKVPMVIVAHGHTGIFYCSGVDDARTLYKLDDSCYLKLQSQYPSMAKALNDAGIGMMLVNSFTKARSDFIVSMHAGDTTWAIFPKGLGANRDSKVSDHAARPFDIFGAAVAAPTVVTWAHSTKLVALGYSHGGTAVMAMDLSKHPVNTQNPSTGAKLFKRVFATYPGCGMESVTTNYTGSGAVVPLILGTASADPLMNGTTMPGTNPATGACRARYDQAVTAAAANASLKTFDWWNYIGADHGWEYTASAPNDAARLDWRTKVITYAVSLK
jgi:dienelactone hydrolase